MHLEPLRDRDKLQSGLKVFIYTRPEKLARFESRLEKVVMVVIGINGCPSQRRIHMCNDVGENLPTQRG